MREVQGMHRFGAIRVGEWGLSPEKGTGAGSVRRRIEFIDALLVNWYGGGPHCATLNEPSGAV
jgi:hypothetical protein